MRLLQAFQMLASFLGTTHLVRVLASSGALHPETTLRGAIVCVLVLAVLPAVLGYFVLCGALPRTGRLIRR
jgi:hypothetical protein